MTKFGWNKHWLPVLLLAGSAWLQAEQPGWKYPPTPRGFVVDDL